MTVERTVLQERLIAIIRRFSQCRILVVGDSIADQFIYGAIDRVSREAPVFILKHEHTETVPGGAANCALNLASLGAQVSLISVAGDDPAGRELARKLQAAGVDCDSLLVSPKLQTTTKVRVLAGQLHSTRQQVIRIDYEGEPLADTELRAQLEDTALKQIPRADAVVISDYNYGVVSAELVSVIKNTAAERKTPLLADSRYRLGDFGGFTSATPNQDEVEQLLGRKFTDLAALETAGEELRERLDYRALLVTRGSNGLSLLEEGVKAFHLDAVGSHEPVDVTGAGDTVMAAYSLALACDASFSDAARLANYAGGLVVMKRGTAAVTHEELENSVLHSEPA